MSANVGPYVVSVISESGMVENVWRHVEFRMSADVGAGICLSRVNVTL